MFQRRNRNADARSLKLTSNPQDKIAVADFFRGTQVFGATGGGKTSGSGRAIRDLFLEEGFGGLVLCVKEDEAASTVPWIRGKFREEDMRIMSIDGPLRFNFLSWIVDAQSIFSASSIAELFVEIVSISSRASTQASKDPFWNQVLARVLTNAISLCYIAKGELRIDHLYLIVFAANSPDFHLPGMQIDGRTYLEGLKNDGLRRIHKSDALKNELAIACDFLLGEFGSLAEKTRSVVYTMFMNLAEQLRREPLRTLFQTTTNISPTDILEGRIVIVDLPIHRLDTIGRMANAIWKTCFKYAVERRARWQTAAHDVFLWADESQYIVDATDARFQTTARANRCATVYLTQNLQNYMMELKDKATVFALIESLTLRFYHQNGDYWTNEEATKRIGMLPISTESTTLSGAKKSTTASEAWQYEVPIRFFTNLKAGGKESGLVVSAIVHVLGRRFSNGKTWIEAEFSQRSAT